MRSKSCQFEPSPVREAFTSARSNSLPNRLWPHVTFTIMVYFGTISGTAFLCPYLPYNNHE
jgi:hypothetical protein